MYVILAASKGYVSYHYCNNRKKQIISIVATTGEEKLYFHVLVPEAKNVESVTASGKTISFKQSKI